MEYKNRSFLVDSLSSYVVTDERIRGLDSAEFIWENAIVGGHWQVWVAPPNAGKTTIAWQAAKDIGNCVETVIYAQFDAAGPELKEFYKEAEAHNVLLASNLDKSPRLFIDTLLKAVADGWNPKGAVVFVDTLKKVVKTMSKDAMEDFGIKVRRLTQMGMTIIFLHHTTKRQNTDGSFDPNGVSDVVDDPDEVFMLTITTDER